MAGWGRWPGGPSWLGRGEGEGRSLSCHESLLGKGVLGKFPRRALQNESTLVGSSHGPSHLLIAAGKWVRLPCAL